MTGALDGKTALITGAAAGIGEAVARLFVAEGARVWLNDINAEGLASLIDELGGADAGVGGLGGDSCDSGFVNEWVGAAMDTYGSTDVLYNNVGGAQPGLLIDMDDDTWRAGQRRTLDSAFFATRAVLPNMIAAGGGSIVSMSSGAGIGGRYNLGCYASAKAALISLMQTVAAEYGRHGVRANAVTPGPTATAPLRAYLESRPGGVGAHVADLNLARLSEPHEVAETVLFLASDASSIVTGVTVECNTRAGGNPPSHDDGSATRTGTR